MNKVIVYPNERGGIAIVYPAPNCGISIEEVARKDVPAGLPHLILNEEDVPTDYVFFEAFEADFSDPHGYGIGAQAWFIEQYQAEIAAITAEPMPARLPDEQQTLEEYDSIVLQWEASKVDRIKQLNRQIAIQQAEINT
jgi:hypothetical protein